MLMILDDSSIIKAFTDDIKTVNVENWINKELHMINIIMAKTTNIINNILIKQFVSSYA